MFIFSSFWNLKSPFPFMIIRIIASSYDSHHIGLNIRRNLRGYPENWVLNCNLGFEKGQRISVSPPRFQWFILTFLLDFPGKKVPVTLFIALELLNPSYASSLLVSPAISLCFPTYTLCTTYWFWIFLELSCIHAFAHTALF